MDTDKPKSADYYRMKADQEWELAGLARCDGDTNEAAAHTSRAREYMRLARLARESQA